MNELDKIKQEIKQIIENEEELDRRVELLIDIYRKTIYISNLMDTVPPLTQHEFRIIDYYDMLTSLIPPTHEQNYSYTFRELRIIRRGRTMTIPPIGPGYEQSFITAITTYKEELRKASEEAENPIIRELARFYYNLAKQLQ